MVGLTALPPVSTGKQRSSCPSSSQGSYPPLNEVAWIRVKGGGGSQTSEQCPVRDDHGLRVAARDKVPSVCPSVSGTALFHHVPCHRIEERTPLCMTY